MPSFSAIDKVNIRPGVSILSVLRHLNYKPWFAIAEFVDNSIQSFLDCRERLREVEGDTFRLLVDIEIESSSSSPRLVIRDNAGGIAESSYHRAFRPAEVPLDRSGLCEFGMGMKSAATWFAPRWSVRTSAIGEDVERLVSFDIQHIVHDDLQELAVQNIPAPASHHYTEIILDDLYRTPQKKTVTKIKEHLASIYRLFLREGILVLRFNGESLEYENPRILVAPYHRTTDAPPIKWFKEINFDLGGGQVARGFAALRAIGSTTDAGFALFRRNRLIQGSADEGYRPEFIFGKSNSFIFQRLFGELSLEGFEVSHTKDGFSWEEHEEVFLQLLKEELDRAPIRLLDQAEGYRARKTRDEYQSSGIEQATERIANAMEEGLPPAVEEQLQIGPEMQPPPETLSTTNLITKRDFDIEINDCKWHIALELSNDPGIGDWLSVSDRPMQNPSDVRTIDVRVCLAHPFMERFTGAIGECQEPLIRVAAALALAEIVARDSGVKGAGTIRRNVNKYLRDVMSNY
jgi:hypothetical protein